MTDTPHVLARLPFHYGWAVVGAGVLTLFACLGLGRFALGMLLPSMGEGLALDYAQMGLIGTGNFLGYLAAVAGAGWTVARLGSRRTIAFGLLVVAASMAGMGAVDAFLPALVLYVVTGVGSGLANVPLMGLVSHWFARRLRGRAAGLMIVGNGLAIVAAGHLVPMINAAGGAAGWRWSWAVLGGLALLATLAAWAALREYPEDLGLAPVGGYDSASHPQAVEAEIPRDRRRVLLHLGLIYFAFGFTYAIYVTFIVTTLVEERGFSEAVAGTFWAWVGALSMLSGPLFGGLSDRLGRRAGLIAAYAFHLVAYALVVRVLPVPLLYASIGLFGLAAFSVPTIMAAAVGDYMGPARAAQGFGIITLFFGVGQVAGPGLAGVLAEAAGGFGSSYLLAAGLAAAAILLTVFLRPPAKEA